jgi:multisubunit Na+/H+ antiporter MnhB subunit
MDTREIIGVIAAVVFIVFAVFLFVFLPQPSINVTGPDSLSQALWEFRSLDVFLQLLIILAGTFSILTLVKERGQR